jgi:hypothetical protein
MVATSVYVYFLTLLERHHSALIGKNGPKIEIFQQKFVNFSAEICLHLNVYVELTGICLSFHACFAENVVDARELKHFYSLHADIK